jgi:hypothetical protein
LLRGSGFEYIFVTFMKKFLAISVAFIYLAITSGLVLQIHYCMGKEAGSAIRFSEADSHACDKCGMEKGKSNCCHDETKFIKIQDSHKQVTNDFQCQPPAVPQQEYEVASPVSHFYSSTIPGKDHSPPGQIPLTILNSVFRL